MENALGELKPERLIAGAPAGASVLCWGKAALSAAAALHRAGSGAAAPKGGVKIPALAISPEEAPRRLREELARGPWCWRFVRGDHPLPGEASFEAGEALLDFFDVLHRFGLRRLEVHLSGGASSLAWVRREGMSRERLRQRLAALYARPLPIARLNAERSRLCALKAGGAADWLRTLAPGVRARVRVVSDVLPCGPEVVGSGPFWDGAIPHEVLADNRRFIRLLAREAGARGWPVLAQEAARLGLWSRWVDEIACEVERGLRQGKRGLILRGGEPQVDLRGAGSGRGGRQTQIAAALLERLSGPLRAGKVEVVCLASDGQDGRSGSAGAWLTAEVAQAAARKRGLRESIERFDTATWLGKAGALLPPRDTGTNVQDAVAALLSD